MPELPEVEVSRLGVEPNLVGRCIIEAVLRTPRLRHALTPELAASLAGKRIDAVRRRGKYLLFDCESSHGGGWLILHLGMSGSLRLVPPGTPAQKHDHVDLVFAHTVLRLRDPRRFGTLVWQPGPDVEAHPLLAVQGIEPLSDAFDGDWLYAATRGRRTPIKPFLMDSHRIVGVGNIYAAESLFMAGINPLREAGKVSRERYVRLADAVKRILGHAITRGGTTLRDFISPDGAPGYFEQELMVYGREGQACVRCGRVLRHASIGQRASVWCGHCQR